MSLYGSVLWDFQYPGIVLFRRFLLSAVNQLDVWFIIPYRTHCALLSLICEDIPVEAQLHSRF